MLESKALIQWGLVRRHFGRCVVHLLELSNQSIFVVEIVDASTDNFGELGDFLWPHGHGMNCYEIRRCSRNSVRHCVQMRLLFDLLLLKGNSSRLTSGLMPLVLWRWRVFALQ